MCEQRVALDMIMGHPKKGGLSKAAIILHEKQCRDFEKLEGRMTNLEKKVDTLGKKFDTLDSKMNTIVDLLSKNQSFMGKIKEVLNNKLFIYMVITFMAAAFGVSVGEVGTFLFK